MLDLPLRVMRKLRSIVARGRAARRLAASGPPADAESVVLVGSRAHGLFGRGKLSRVFLDRAADTLAGYGVPFETYRDLDDFSRRFAARERAVLCLVYNEDADPSVFDEMEQVEALVAERCQDPLIFNPVATGRIIGDKAKLNDLFSSRGVPIPAMRAGSSGSRVFSNSRRGTALPVQVYEAGEAPDPERYNTEFIDTVHRYRGRSFHVSLRALCVETECAAIYLRCRDADESNPSVHAADTPLDPDLLNFLHCEVVIPRQREILQACALAGEVLGPGLYAHDILPCQRTGQVYICEPGMKFDEIALREHLLPVRRSVPYPALFNGLETVTVTTLLVRQARIRGHFRHLEQPAGA